jgi:hypothetical protein
MPIIAADVEVSRPKLVMNDGFQSAATPPSRSMLLIRHAGPESQPVDNFPDARGILPAFDEFFVRGVHLVTVAPPEGKGNVKTGMHRMRP